MTTETVYEDRAGTLLMAEEVDELSPYEIEEKGIHIFNDSFQFW